MGDLITAVLTVETDIIISIAASQTGRDVILVIMYVKIFETGVIVFIGEVKCVFFKIRVSSCACKLRTHLIFFVDQGQFSDPDFISSTHRRENVQFGDKKNIKPVVTRYLYQVL